MRENEFTNRGIFWKGVKWNRDLINYSTNYENSLDGLSFYVIFFNDSSVFDINYKS